MILVLFNMLLFPLLTTRIYLHLSRMDNKTTTSDLTGYWLSADFIISIAQYIYIYRKRERGRDRQIDRQTEYKTLFLFSSHCRLLYLSWLLYQQYFGRSTLQHSSGAFFSILVTLRKFRT